MVTHITRDEYSVASILCQFYVSVVIAGIITAQEAVSRRLHSGQSRGTGVQQRHFKNTNLWGESVNLRHGAAKMKKVYSKKKVQPSTSERPNIVFCHCYFFAQIRPSQMLEVLSCAVNI